MHLKSLIAGGALAFAAAGAFAQDYPNRPVTVIVPFVAGGPSHLLARIYGEFFARTLGQQFVIEHEVGAGGANGALRAARSKPDGYTVLVDPVASHVSSPMLHSHASYDPIKSFIPIGTLAYSPHYVVVRKNFPAKDLKSLIEYAKANPTKINYGSAGEGSENHLACVLFGHQAGVQITHVPYSGWEPALNALVAGTLDMMCSQGLNMIRQAKAGTVNVLAIAQKTRFPGLPNVPTTAEAGLPSFETKAAMAMYAVAGTPEPIVEKLVDTLVAALKDEGVRKRIQDLGFELPSHHQATPAGLDVLEKLELDHWSDIIKKPEAVKLRDELMVLEKGSWDFMRNNNADGMRNYLSDDALLILGDGSRLNKREMLEFMKDFVLTDIKIEPTYALRMLTADVANLIYRASYTRTLKGGKPETFSVSFSSVYVRRDGKWWSVFYQETPIK